MALIPPFFLNTVVALGGPSQDGTVQYNATGFLYGFPTGETDANGAKRFRLYLVSARKPRNSVNLNGECRLLSGEYSSYLVELRSY